MKVDEKLRRFGYLGEMKRRSWVKSIIWRVIGIFILGGLSWLVTRDWQETTIITVVFHAVRTVLYYYHERMWDKIEWGRIKA